VVDSVAATLDVILANGGEIVQAIGGKITKGFAPQWIT
jgi:hypothetical protein